MHQQSFTGEPTFRRLLSFLAWFKMEVNGRNGRSGGNTEEKEDEERVKLLPTFGPPNFTNVDPPFGTVCRTMWSLLRLCRPSVGVWKQFCSRPHSLTLSSTTVNLLPTLSGYWWFYYLDHSKNTWLIGGCAYTFKSVWTFHQLTGMRRWSSATGLLRLTSSSHSSNEQQHGVSCPRDQGQDTEYLHTQLVM